MSCTPHAEAARAENRAAITTKTFRKEKRRDELRPPPSSDTPRPTNTAMPESRACGTGGLRSFHLPTLLTAVVARVVRAWARIGRWRHLPSSTGKGRLFTSANIWRGDKQSLCHNPRFPPIAREPREGTSTAFQPRRDKSIVPTLRRAGRGILVRLTRFYGGAWGVLYGGGDRVTPGPPPTGLFPPVDGSGLVWDNAIVEREWRTYRASP